MKNQLNDCRHLHDRNPRVKELDQWLKAKVETSFPGAVALIAQHGSIVFHKSYGLIERDSSQPMPEDAIFDLESLTKVVATATLTLSLIHQKKISLGTKVCEFIPEFSGEGKDEITVRHLISYTSGLSDDDLAFDIEPSSGGVAEAWMKMFKAPIHFKPGSQYKYTDLGYRILGKLLERVGEDSLQNLCSNFVWAELEMGDTFFNPSKSCINRVAGNGEMRGRVEDAQDYLLGGIVGCDGVFSSAMDLAKFCQMILNNGMFAGRQFLPFSLVQEMTSSQIENFEYQDSDRMTNLVYGPKGFGWELMAGQHSIGGTQASYKSFGKSGGGGSFIWIDPKHNCFGVLLTNHGLPTPFDEIGWLNLLENVQPFVFFDMMAKIVQADR